MDTTGLSDSDIKSLLGECICLPILAVIITAVITSANYEKYWPQNDA